MRAAANVCMRKGGTAFRAPGGVNVKGPGRLADFSANYGRNRFAHSGRGSGLGRQGPNKR